jgi:hypothetical protein
MAGKIYPPPGTEFALNVLLHVFVMFLALTVLFKVMVAPKESKTLTAELSETFQNAVDDGWNSVVKPANAASLQPALSALLPFLTRLSNSFNKADSYRQSANNNTMLVAYGIIALLGVTFVVAVAVLVRAGVDMKRVMAQVGIENLVVFSIVGSAEAAFFLAVASKFVPVMPSEITNDIFKLVQGNGAAPA